jgi:hypothetical protein
MKNLLVASTLICLMSVAVTGCERTNNNVAALSRESQLSKPISLKNITTGSKAEKPVDHWSYFGKERQVQTEELPDGTIASISVLMDGGDAFNLRNELEVKYSKEEGHPVRFACSWKERRLAMLDNAKISDNVCTLQHKDQVLTVYEVSPNDSNLLRDHYALRSLFYSTKLTLADKRLVALRNSALEQAEADEKKRKAEQEEKELDKARKDL